MGLWQNPGIKIPSPTSCHREVRDAFKQMIQKFGLSGNNVQFGKPIPTATALRFLATNASKAPVTIALSDRLSGTSNQVILTDNSDGTFTLSLPQSIHPGATPEFAGATFTGFTGILKAVTGVLTGGATHADLASVTSDQHHAKSHLHNGADGSGTVAHSDTTGKGTDDHHAQTHTIPSHDTTATGANLTTMTDGSNADALHKHITTDQLLLSSYDAQPVRNRVSNVHGGILQHATGQPLDSVPTNIVFSKGTGKVMIVVNAGSDLAGDITVTGTTVDRDTGATTPSDTDTLTVDAATTDSSTTDSNGNTVYVMTGAYLTSKWFTGSVTLSTTNLTLTDVDVYHVSFEQFNDTSSIILDTLDVNMCTTNAAAEFDCYLYSITVTGDKCDIANLADLHVGADGETAIADTFWRLRRGSLAVALDGAAEGVWVDIHYANNPNYVEDVCMKLWGSATRTTG